MRYADAHADLFFEVAFNECDIFKEQNTLHFTYQGMLKAKQRLQVCSLWTPPKYKGQEAREFCDQMLDALDGTVAAHPDKLRKVQSGEELRSLGANDSAPIGLVPWIEGASPLMGDIAVFHEYADRGVKGIGLTWNHANEVADGCGVKEPRRGLTDFGHCLVEEMEARRVLVDAAHLPEPAFWDVMAMAKRPVVITHCGLRWRVPITRNPSAAMAKAVADSGGFVGIDFYPGHIVNHTDAPLGRKADLNDLVATITDAINVCGVDNVVLGGDFDGFRDPIVGLTGVWDIPNLEQAMLDSGLASSSVEKVMGRNLIERLVALW
ncbi:MAG: membrane dipeptidase [Planctomycetes bacterium]|nr:membrane dipeptidase [Planctomycetota bacterium]